MNFATEALGLSSDSSKLMGWSLKTELEKFLVSGDLEEEFETAVRMIAYLEEKNQSAFDRKTRPAHFTGSAIVLSPNKDEVLLIKHRKLGRWLQPGGHADGEENLLLVALKEVFEETGVEAELLEGSKILGVDWHPIPESPKEEAHEHADVAFMFKAPSKSTILNEEETNGLKWFSIDQALTQTEDESVRKYLRKVKRRVQKS